MRRLNLRGNPRVAMVGADMARGVDMVTKIDIVIANGKIYRIKRYKILIFASDSRVYKSQFKHISIN